jgi:molecular chaperone GrpE
MKKDKKIEEEILDQQSEIDIDAAEIVEEELTIENLQAKNLELLADMENLRKRLATEKADLIKYGAKNLIEEILPSLDLFRSALEAKNVSDEVKN